MRMCDRSLSVAIECATHLEALDTCVCSPKPVSVAIEADLKAFQLYTGG